MTSNKSYYDPEGGKAMQKLIPGKYNAHITNVEVIEQKMIQNYCANIYNITVTIDKNVDNFGGREVKSSGVFHFLAPQDGDSFENNASGNNKYYNLLKACGIECPTETISINDSGDTREVYMLPDLAESIGSFDGKALVAKVGETKPFTNSEGKTITPIKVVWFETWEGGVDRDLVDESIPF